MAFRARSRNLASTPWHIRAGLGGKDNRHDQIDGSCFSSGVDPRLRVGQRRPPGSSRLVRRIEVGRLHRAQLRRAAGRDSARAARLLSPGAAVEQAAASAAALPLRSRPAGRLLSGLSARQLRSFQLRGRAQDPLWAAFSLRAGARLPRPSVSVPRDTRRKALSCEYQRHQRSHPVASSDLAQPDPSVVATILHLAGALLSPGLPREVG